ncbi:MAG: hypothetical protein U0V70_10120 [Terriglobia bacterium]
MILKRCIAVHHLRWVFYLWIGIWGWFWLRPLILGKSNRTQDLGLTRMSFEERRQQVYGRDLEQFLEFCRSRLPAGAGYRLVGIDPSSLDSLRSIYSLYPNLLSADPEYLLVFKQPQFRPDHATLLASLDEGSFILKLPLHTP